MTRRGSVATFGWVPAVALVLLALDLAAAPAFAASGTEERPRVAFVTTFGPCSSANFLCPPARRALERAGVEGRIIALDVREDLAGTLALLARQGNDLIVVDPAGAEALGAVAPRFPATRFALVDAPHSDVPGRPRNVQGVVLRTNEASFLAGWLAARLEQRRPGRDVVGAVGGLSIPLVDDFIVGFRAGAQFASKGVTVLVGYSGDFADPSRCEAVARRQIARGAGVVFNVAGGCGLGTLKAARAAGVWGIGVDLDQSSLGPHVLTSVVKGFDAAFLRLFTAVRNGTLKTGGTTELNLREGGAALGRISPKVPAALRRELATVRNRILSGEIEVPGVPPP